MPLSDMVSLHADNAEPRRGSEGGAGNLSTPNSPDHEPVNDKALC